MIFIVCANNQSLREAERRLNVLHPDHPVSITYSRELERKFRAAGPVQDATRTGKTSIEEDLKLD